MSESEPIVLTTEGPRGGASSRALRFVAGAVSFVCIALVVLIWTIPSSDVALHCKATVTAWGLVVAGSVHAMAYLVPRGTWVVDSEGVTFEPLRGGKTCLGWAEVEQVQWRWQSAIVRRGKTSITLSWGMFDKDDAARAMRFVESTLSPMFDLAPYERPQHFRRGIWCELIWLGKMVAISVPLAAVCLSGSLAAALWAPDSTWAKALGFFMVFTPWLLLIPVAIRERRRYPVWRSRRDD